MQNKSPFPRFLQQTLRAHGGDRLRGIVRRTARCIFAACLLQALVSCASDSVNDRRVGQLMVCHKGKSTMAVSNADSFLHLDHGDTLGPCPEQQ